MTPAPERPYLSIIVPVKNGVSVLPTMLGNLVRSGLPREDELLRSLAPLVLSCGERTGAVVEALGGRRCRVLGGSSERGRCECRTGHYRRPRRSDGQQAARASIHGFLLRVECPGSPGTVREI